jgi:hypothetical protein
VQADVQSVLLRGKRSLQEPEHGHGEWKYDQPRSVCHDGEVRFPEHENIRQVCDSSVDLSQQGVLRSVKQNAQNSDKQENVMVCAGSGVKGMQRDGSKQTRRGR